MRNIFLSNKHRPNRIRRKEQDVVVSINHPEELLVQYCDFGGSSEPVIMKNAKISPTAHCKPCLTASTIESIC